VIDVSCTGITIPALDVRLVPALGLRRDVRRVPITESGCAAGALALGLASSFAERGLKVLVVAVEVCSLSLVQGDRSRTSLVASVLFGDGAAAAVILPGGSGPRIAAVGSHLIEDTEGTMGFAVGGHGLQIILQRELPSVLVEHLPEAQERFLREHGRTAEDIGLHLIHPGGRRILEAYSELHGLAPDALRFSRESLRRFGNLSSASVLTVLELALEARVPVPAEKDAFLMAIGPGLSIEMILLDWKDAR
jgi:alkylresorcinol/alkylpyrone synthase